MWKVIGSYTEVMCDCCGKQASKKGGGEIVVRVGNVIVAEVCEEHAMAIKAAIACMLKTKPGPLGKDQGEWVEGTLETNLITGEQILHCDRSSAYPAELLKKKP